MKKSLKLAAAAVLAALCLSTLKPVRTWASVEGSYIYHQLIVAGPVTINASPVGLGSGITVTAGSIVEQGGSLSISTAPSATLSIQFLGVLASSPTASTEGQQYYNSTAHAMYQSTCTVTATQGLSGMICWLAY